VVVQLDLPIDKIQDFCRRHQVRQLALFGSILQDDFRPDSDVDVLVEFEEGSTRTLFDHIRAEEELEGIFGRKVDLVEKKTLKNPFRKHHILNNHEVIYLSP
jgi:uncharacterized protein